MVVSYTCRMMLVIIPKERAIHMRNICVTDDHGYVPLVVVINSLFLLFRNLSPDLKQEYFGTDMVYHIYLILKCTVPK